MAGDKTMEARIARVRCAPFGRVEVGDRIYFKQTGGLIGAAAIVTHVRTFDDLTPAGLRQLRARWNGQILGTPEFWRGRRGCRYATLIELGDVNADVSASLASDLLTQIPRGSRSGWHVIDPAPLRRAA